MSYLWPCRSTARSTTPQWLPLVEPPPSTTPLLCCTMCASQASPPTLSTSTRPAMAPTSALSSTLPACKQQVGPLGTASSPHSAQRLLSAAALCMLVALSSLSGGTQLSGQSSHVLACKGSLQSLCDAPLRTAPQHCPAHFSSTHACLLPITPCMPAWTSHVAPLGVPACCLKAVPAALQAPTTPSASSQWLTGACPPMPHPHCSTPSSAQVLPTWALQCCTTLRTIAMLVRCLHCVLPSSELDAGISWC